MGHLCLIIVTSSMLPDHAKFIQYGCELQHLFFLLLSLLSSLLPFSLYSFSTGYNSPLSFFITAQPIIQEPFLFTGSSQYCPPNNWIECACLVAQSCPTHYDPVHCSPPGSSVHGIILVRILEWVSMPSSRYTEYRTQNTIRLVQVNLTIFLSPEVELLLFALQVQSIQTHGCGRPALNHIEESIMPGVPNPQAMDQYKSVVCQELGCTAGGEWQASEQTFICTYSLSPWLTLPLELRKTSSRNPLLLPFLLPVIMVTCIIISLYTTM